MHIRSYYCCMHLLNSVLKTLDMQLIAFTCSEYLHHNRHCSSLHAPVIGSLSMRLTAQHVGPQETGCQPPQS